MANTDKRTVAVQIVGDATQYKKAMSEAEAHTSKSGAAITGIFTGIGISATHLAEEGIHKVVEFLGESSKKAQEEEVNTERLTTALRNNVAGFKGSAEVMAEAIDKGKSLGFTDDELSASLSRLVTVTHDTKKAQDDQAIAMDLARARGISLEEATQIITKAQLGNIGALKKQGIEVVAVTTAVDALKASHQKYTPEQLKAAEAADKQATAVAALAAIQKSAAGQADAYAGTMAGSMARANILIETVQERLGKTINDLVATVLPPLIDALSGVADWFGQVLESIQPLVDQISSALKPALDVITENGDALLPVLAALGAIVASTVVPPFLAWAASTVIALAPIIALGAAVAAVVLILEKLGVIDWITKNLLPPLQAAFGVIAGVVTNVLGAAIGFLADTVIPAMSTAFKTAGQIIGAVWDGISGAVKGAINVVIGAINTFIGAIDSIRIPAIDVGPVHFAGWDGFNIGKIPTLAVGTPFVERDGLAYLHRGEAVMPAQVAPANAAMARGGAASSTVNIRLDVTAQGLIDPYGAVSQQIAQTLIPGLKRELARQGLTLA